MQNLQSRFTGIKTRASVALVSVMAAGAASAQEATLPPEVGTAFSGISDNFESMAAMAWPVVGTIVGGFILVKLFKKFANKAS